MYEHAVFYLTAIKQPIKWLRDFRAAESKGGLSSFSSVFQPVLQFSCGHLESVGFAQEHHHNYFSPTGMNPPARPVPEKFHSTVNDAEQGGTETCPAYSTPSTPFQHPAIFRT